MHRLLIVATMIATVALGGGAGLALAGGSGGDGLSLSAPSHADTDTSFAIELQLPARVAAVDGRILFDTTAAELVGVAPAGTGTGLAPVEITGGAAFGAYGLTPSNGHTLLNVVLAPHVDGRLHFRVVIDAVADATGARIALKGAKASGAISMGTGGGQFALPSDRGRALPVRTAGGTRDLVADGRVGVTDLDVIRAGWEQAHSSDAPCAGLDAADDANGDGCVDIVDIQALVADQGWPTAAGVAVNPAQAHGITLDQPPAAHPADVTAAATGLTFTVTSTADTPDAKPGDGICADSQGRCTLRAAISEANWQTGDNRIEFNLPGTAPVPIQFSSSPQEFPHDRTGGVVIDGYSQPGSQVNTATVGSNAVPGVELRGTGNSPRSYGLRLTSANNTIRGFLFNGFYHEVVLDGVDAHDNTIVGNLMGYSRTGAPDSYAGHDNVYLENGANHNHVGAPTLADRNVAGRQQKSLYMYGPGTDYNVLQNNFLCMTPSGMATATCSTGIDHDFGPKHTEDGGTGPLERNVIGGTTLNGIEISHGWNPNGADVDDTWHNNYNHLVGNWIGFRGDGSYNAAFRSALNNPGSGDNGNAVNVYDGSNYNIVEGNWVASAYDGIQTMSINSTGNIIRNNIIGQSPLGQAAPLGRDGIVARLNTRSHTIQGNTVRNAGRYGIGLTQPDVLWVRVSQNIVTDMSGPAIYLAPNPSDPTKGADELQRAPIITSATTVEVDGTGTAGATVEVYRASRPAGQSGLPIEYLGSSVVAADGTWSLPVVLQTGDRATALQIAPSGNTSMLGLNVAAVFEQPPAAPVANFSWDQVPGTQDVDFTDTSTGSPAAWSWNFGDGDTSAEQNPSHSYASTGDFTVSLTATNAGGSSTVSETVTVAASAQTFFAADSFGRTVSNGWGSAETGGLYTVVGTAADYNVTGGVGTMQVGATKTRSALLDGVSERDVDITFRVAADKVATGGAYFVYAVARRNSNNEYRPQLIFKTNGSVSVQASVLIGGSESSLGAAVVVPGVTQSVGAFIWVHAQVTGANPTTVRINAWADGQPEPAGWLFTATNSAAAVQSTGSVGLRTYLASAATNAPVTVSFDDYAVSATGSSTAIAADAFSRSTSNSWGSADIGGLYTVQGTIANYSVAGGVGLIAVPAGGLTRSALLNDLSQSNVDIRFRVALDKVATGGAYFVYAVARRNSNNEYRPQLIFKTNGSVSVQASVLIGGSESSLGAAVVVPGVTQAAGAFIWVHAQVTGANPTTVRINAWADGQPEPTGWLFSATNSAAAVQSAGAVGLRTYVASAATNAPVTFSFDDYSVNASQ
jgi:CSLREA domain-containing protein